MVIDATNLIVGRLATIAAKKILLGETIDIVNCENAVIRGSKDEILQRYKIKKERGTFKGPLFYRRPSQFVRRIIRGMLPYKKDKGRQAFAKIKCYQGVPENLKDKKLDTFEDIDVTTKKYLRCLKVSEVCKSLGGKL